jgi:hypothetical protein
MDSHHFWQGETGVIEQRIHGVAGRKSGGTNRGEGMDFTFHARGGAAIYKLKAATVSLGVILASGCCCSASRLRIKAASSVMFWMEMRVA